MSTSLKKLLLVSITLLLGVMSGRVVAQNTSYDFTSNGNPLEGNAGIAFNYVSGTFTVDSIGNAVSGTLYTNGELNPDQSFFGSYSNTSPSVFWFAAHGTGVGIFSPAMAEMAFGDSLINLSTFRTQLAQGTVTCSSGCSGSGAPEMNASFIPQVGLLLACLFFLFGRKREVVEPLLSA